MFVSQYVQQLLVQNFALFFFFFFSFQEKKNAVLLLGNNLDFIQIVNQIHNSFIFILCLLLHINYR